MKTSFVEYHQFDSKKIKDVREKMHLSNGFKMYTPIYSYTDRSSYPLMIRTEFMDLTSDPFRFITTDSKKFISVNPNDISVSHMYKTFQDLAGYTVNYFSNAFEGSSIKEIGPILSNYKNYGSMNFTNGLDTELAMRNIKFFFSEKGDKITSTIYNYNKSKKYAPVEEFNMCTLKDIARFVTKGKQVRFILEPKIWFSESGRQYGTKLYIKYMEVRYKDQFIKSKLDENKIELYDQIKSVEI